MKNIQLPTFLKKNIFILGFILVVFFLRGIFLSTIFPIFTGQDEARHYATVQYISEPKEKNWNFIERKMKKDKDDIDGYNFSQEIRETGKISGLNKIRQDLFESSFFSDSYKGIREEEIEKNKWNHFNEFSTPDIGGRSLYHQLASLIEKGIEKENILVRFFLIRIFSVFLGVIAILIFYLIAKNIGFSSKISLLLTAIASFQPRFIIYTTNINYDALLILSFATFSLAGTLIIKNGLSWRNTLLLIFSITLGLLTKGTAVIILIAALCLLLIEIYRKIKDKVIFFLSLLLVLIALISSPYNPIKYLPISRKGSSLTGALISLKEYLIESLTIGRLEFSSKIYWGYAGWINSWFLENFIYFIWFVEFFALIGLILFFISKKKQEFLPEKKYILFFLFMIGALQIGIRAYDWNIFSSTGGFDLGTPGRYFLPNLFAHLIIIFTGLGMLLKKENRFINSLALGLIAMFSFSMYIIFNIIIPRFYL